MGDYLMLERFRNDCLQRSVAIQRGTLYSCYKGLGPAFENVK